MTPSRFLVTPQVRALHGSRVDDFGAAAAKILENAKKLKVIATVGK